MLLDVGAKKLILMALGVLLLAFHPTSFAAQEVAQTFTLDGKLYSDTAATTPLVDASVVLKIQILNQAETCILYEETQTISTLTSGGLFTVQVGSATGAGKRSAGYTATMQSLFSNTVSGLAGKLVSDGVTACVYNPAAGDERYVRLQITPSVDSVTRTITPNMLMDSVPMAVVAERAESLRGLAPTDLVQVNATTASLSQVNIENIFSNINYPKLNALVNGTSTQYIVSSPSASVGFNNQRIVNVADPTGAQDAATKNYADTSVGGKGVDVTGVGPGFGGGKTLVWDQAQNKWVAQTAAYVSGIVAGSGLLGGTITSSGTISVDTGTTANQIVRLDGSAYLPAVDAHLLTNISFPVLSVNAKTGVVVLVPSDISGLGTAATRNVGTNAGNVMEFLTNNQIQALDGSLLTSVSATYLRSRLVAATLPTSGQILTWNGSQWEPQAAVVAGITDLYGDVTAVGPGNVNATIGNDKITSAKINNTGNVANRLLMTDATTGATVTYASCSTTGEVMVYNVGTGWGCGVVSAQLLQGRTVASTAPTLSQVLAWNGSQWQPMTASTGDFKADGSVPMTGAFRAATGSEASPSVSFSGDTGKGLFDAGVGTLGLSTGGVQRVTVDASGNVGFGTTSPITRLHIEGSTVNKASITLNNTGAPTNFSNISFDSSSFEYARIQGKSLTVDSGNLIFQSATGGVLSEGMRLSETGFVGIGTATPKAILDVYGTGTGQSAMIVPRDTTALRPGGVNGMIRYNSQTNKMEVFENAAWINLMTGAGAAGDFMANGSVPMTGNFNAVVGSAALPGISFVGDTDTGIFEPGANTLGFSTGGSQRLTITSAGLVGIGTTNPTYELELQKSQNAGTGMLISNPTSGTNATAGIAFSSTTTTGNIGQISAGFTDSGMRKADRFHFEAGGASSGLSLNTVGADPIEFGTNDTSRMTIDSSGNVGIGTTSPGALLEIGSNSTASSSIRFVPSATSQGSLRFTTNAAANWLQSGLDFTAGSGKDLRIANMNGSATWLAIKSATGNVGIGTTNPQAILDVYGTGTGQSAMIVPRDTTALRPAGVNGMIRYNSQTNKFEGYANGGWANVATGTVGSGDFMADGSVPMTGNFNAVSGSAALPGVSFAGDTDTGIFEPGANTLGFSTGGVQRMMVDSSGNVGIGTTTSDSLLKLRRDSATSLDILTLHNDTPAGTDKGPAMEFEGQNGSAQSGVTMGRIASGWSAANDNANMDFYTRNSGTLGLALRLGYSGQVNVGSNPAFPPATAKLNVFSASTAGNAAVDSLSLVHSDSNSAGASGIGTRIRFYGESDADQTYPELGMIEAVLDDATDASKDSSLRFYTLGANSGVGVNSATEKMRIDSAGNVGIGTSSPQAILDVRGTGTLQSAMLVPRDTTALRPTGVNGMIRYNSQTNKMETFENGSWTNFATGAVGTGDFMASGSVPMTGNFNAVAGSAALPGISFAGDTDTGMFEPGADTLGFTTGGVQRMTVDSSGRVGIGTTTPSSILHVESSITSTGNTNAAYNQLTVNPSGVGGMYNAQYIYVRSIGTNTVGKLNGIAAYAEASSSGNATSVAGGSLVAESYGPVTKISGVNTYAGRVANFSVTTVQGGEFIGENAASGTVTNIKGLRADAFVSTGPATNSYGIDASSLSSQNTTNAYGINANVSIDTGGSTISDGYAGYFKVTRTAGTITRGYGVYIGDTAGTTQYGLYQAGTDDTNYLAGRVGIGTSTPQAMLDVVGTGTGQSAMIVPRDTTALRPGGVNGMIRYNTNTNRLEGYENGMWGNISAATSGGGASQWTTAGSEIYYNLGNVGIGTTMPLFTLSLGDGASADGSILAKAYGGVGVGGKTLTEAGAGRRMFWYGKKGAFRAGEVTSTAWDDVNIGNNSVAFGIETKASGVVSFAVGKNNSADGLAAIALGEFNTATGDNSVAIGRTASAYGGNGVAIGNNVSAQSAFGTGGIVIGRSAQVGTGYGWDNNGTFSVLISAGNASGAVPVLSGNNSFGVVLGDQSGLTMLTNNVMTVMGGRMGIGTTAPQGMLDVVGTGTGQSAMIVPRDTTALRPGGVNGMIRYNTNLNVIEGYMYGAWTALNNAIVGRVDITSTPYTITSTQAGNYFSYTNAATGVINLPSLATLPDGWQVTIVRSVANSLTLTPNGADALANGVTTLEMQGHNLQSVTLTKTGSFWAITNRTEDCIVGQACWAAGNIYVGSYKGHQYFTTPGGCTNSGTPTCAGGTDTVTKAWANNSGTTAYNVNAIATDEVLYGGTQSNSLATGYTDTDAAKFCENMNYAGHVDWYLPASHELQLLGRNSPTIDGFSFTSAYWTSTEFSITAAVVVNFINSAVVQDPKTTTNYVRCMRRF